MMKYALAGALIALGLATVAAPAFAGSRNIKCYNCASSKKYDSREVVKKVRDIDHSRVIDTQSVVRVKRRIVNKNHLVVHKNLTRHVGVVRHRHTVIEREIRYVRPTVTTVNYVTHGYRAVRRPWTAPPRTIVYPASSGCGYNKFGERAQCEPVLDVRG